MQYGLACAEAIKEAQKSSILDRLLTDIVKDPAPDYTQSFVLTDLRELQELSRLMHKEQKELQERYIKFDRNMRQFYMNIFFDGDDHATSEYRKIIENIFEDVPPLVHKIKLNFQGPRPVQLAVNHSLDFHPLASISDYPAFPSLHSCLAMVLGEVCGNNFPQSYKFFKDQASDVYLSRLYMGVCLRMDVDAGVSLAKRILSDAEFKIKYRL